MNIYLDSFGILFIYPKINPNTIFIDFEGLKGKGCLVVHDL